MKLNKEVLIIYDYNVKNLTVFDSTSVASSKFSFSNFFLSKPCVRRRLTFEVTPTMRYNPWSSKPSLRYCKCYIYFSIQNTNALWGLYLTWYENTDIVWWFYLCFRALESILLWMWIRLRPDTYDEHFRA